MATERLYFADAYQREFDATVTRAGTFEGQPAAVLDRSAFYPEGGGQPGDTGTLGGVAVLDTQSDDAGDVWHVLAAPLGEGPTHGAIDWGRRWDFMQQHHGQHLLSAAAEELLGAKTLAVHLGEEGSTVDLAIAALTPEQIAALERRTNEMIWADVAIDARFVTADELARLDLRKPAQSYERIRIVSAGDFDHSACGGTHPRRTGEVGSVVLRRWERYKGGARVEFVCGGRAIQDYRARTELLQTLAGELKVGLPELPAAVERLRAAEERQRKRLGEAEERLVDVDAAELVAGAEQVAGVPVVVRAFDDRSLDSLRLLGRRIAERGGVALLGLRADKAQLVFTRGGAAPWDMGALLKAAAEVVGGRGGGKPDAAQGGGPDVTQLDAALATALETIRK